MAKTVRVIPASPKIFRPEVTEEPRRRRTAGYARVSTDHEEQASSYEMQMAHYKNYIESRADWDFVGMYSDEGISGTNTKKRDGFNQMIEDALAGKIDLIITKSVSRFARNTVDSLQNVRKLKEHGVEIYFEKENIWTFDTRGELLITIMSSLAQEESRSISENTTWGKRKQFAEGKTSVGYSTFLGYDKDFKINEEQAKIVRLIYKLFLGGRSFYAITKELEKRGIKSPSGKDKWYISTVRSILTNEKYRGDALIQKEYTADFLDKTRRKNTGEIPQYYVEEHHEAIIPPDLFDFVQTEIKARENGGKHSGVSIFANKIKCGCCGGWYGAKVWHSTDKYRRVIYRCNKKYSQKGKPCSTRHLTEEEIKRIFVKALNSLVEVKESVIAELRSLIDGICQTGELTEERNGIEQELAVLTERLEMLIHENARVAQNQTAYLKQENEIRARYLEKQGHIARLGERIAERESKRKTLEGMIQVVCGINGELVEFDEDLWSGLLEHIVVKEGGAAVVVFKGGVEIGVYG
ncbi:recombinase family protein [Selenomonas artemidis]|uniref:recombinase family protein n=1 Tax=Selenomonas artemidis TaxID=671224 RepID=UPI00040F2A4D|nr:recombinase family protein [Selenomonas artemidis]